MSGILIGGDEHALPRVESGELIIESGRFSLRLVVSVTSAHGEFVSRCVTTETGNVGVDASGVWFTPDSHHLKYTRGRFRGAALVFRRGEYVAGPEYGFVRVERRASAAVE